MAERLTLLLQGPPSPEKIEELTKISSSFSPTPEHVKLLANAARSPGWRDSLRLSGFLGIALANLNAASDDDELMVQILRLLGNCCADDELSREQTIPFLGAIIACTKKTALQDTAVAVLFNICNDFDLGKEEVVKQGFIVHLVSLLQNQSGADEESINSLHLDFLTMLIPWLSLYLQKEDLSQSWYHALTRQIPLWCDNMEQYTEYMDAIIFLLDKEPIQDLIVEEDTSNLPPTFEAAEDNQAKECHRLIARSLLEGNSKWRERTKEPLDLRKIEELDKKIISLGSDIAYKLKYETSEKLRADSLIPALRQDLELFSYQDHLSLMRAELSCFMLGNIAQSDTAAIEMVKSYRVHTTINNVILGDTESSSGLLSAAVGLMGHLAIPKENYQTLVTDGLCDVLEALIGFNDKNLQIRTLKLIRTWMRNSKTWIQDADRSSKDLGDRIVHFVELLNKTVGGCLDRENEDDLTNELKLEITRTATSMRIWSYGAQKVLDFDIRDAFSMVFLVQESMKSNNPIWTSRAFNALALAVVGEGEGNAPKTECVYEALRARNALVDIEKYLSQLEKDTEFGKEMQKNMRQLIETLSKIAKSEDKAYLQELLA